MLNKLPQSDWGQKFGRSMGLTDRETLRLLSQGRPGSGQTEHYVAATSSGMKLNFHVLDKRILDETVKRQFKLIFEKSNSEWLKKNKIWTILCFTSWRDLPWRKKYLTDK